MKIKYLFLTLLMTVYGTLAFLLPQKTYAWAGDLPTCEVGGALGFDWKDKIRQQYSGQYDIDSWSKSLLIMSFDNNPTSTEYVLAVYFADSVSFNQSTGGNRTISWTNARQFNITKDPNSSYYQDTVTSISFLTTQSNVSPSCIMSAKNVIYSSSYTGVVYTDALPQQENDCQGFDVACYVQTGLNSVANTIRDIFQATINLFIPQGEQISSEIQRIYDFYTEKLGFLAYPITFLVDANDTLTNAGNSFCNANNCVLDLGNFYGSNVQIDFLTIQQINAQLWTFILFIIRGATIIWIIERLHDEYLEMVKS